MDKCVFCCLDKSRVIHESRLFFVIRDAFPVTQMHSLVIPKRHVVSYFELNLDEANELPRIVKDMRSSLLNEDPKISGFNIGINDGEDAGQTVFHCHIHLIPRRHGDASDPRGGVRGVIPDKQHY
jgi:ATP adenylyltransferase